MKLRDFVKSYFTEKFWAISCEASCGDRPFESTVFFNDRSEELSSRFGDLELTDASVSRNPLGCIKFDLVFGEAYRFVKVRASTFELDSLELPDEVKALVVISEAP